MLGGGIDIVQVIKSFDELKGYLEKFIVANRNSWIKVHGGQKVYLHDVKTNIILSDYNLYFMNNANTTVTIDDLVVNTANLQFIYMMDSEPNVIHVIQTTRDYEGDFVFKNDIYKYRFKDDGTVTQIKTLGSDEIQMSGNLVLGKKLGKKLRVEENI